MFQEWLRSCWLVVWRCLAPGPMAGKGAAMGAIKEGVGATPAGIKGAIAAAAMPVVIRGAIIIREIAI